ncbi:MAG: hypothetical protein HFE45_02275 [Oscillospiraceae bacterium]|nr:hypothetical protein [Oscillospiraceae bacterium]
MEQNTQQKQRINLHNSVKELSFQLWKTLLLCTLICVVVVISLSGVMVNGLWGPLLTETICLLLTGLTLYTQMWGAGDRDANFIQFGRIERDPLKGLKIGLIVIIPSLLLNIPLALSMVELIPIDLLPFYRILQAPVWPLINLIHPHGAVAHEATAAIEELNITAMPATPGLGWGQFALLWLLPFIYTFFVVAGYELGIRRIELGFKLMYEDKKKKNARETGRK